MKQSLQTLVLFLLVLGTTGCSLNEIRGKNKFGPEYRRSGSRNTHATRWTAQQGLEFKWDNGVNTGVTYRYRETVDGVDDKDNGIWFEVSYPLWKKKKQPDDLALRVNSLERRLAELEPKTERG